MIDIMTADEARKLLPPAELTRETDEAMARLGLPGVRDVTERALEAVIHHATEAERLRAQLRDLATRARPLLEATEGHTPGPWEYDPYDGDPMWVTHPTDPDCGTIVIECADSSPIDPTDLPLVLGAPDLRAIVAEVVALADGGEDV